MDGLEHNLITPLQKDPKQLRTLQKEAALVFFVYAKGLSIFILLSLFILVVLSARSAFFFRPVLDIRPEENLFVLLILFMLFVLSARNTEKM